MKKSILFSSLLASAILAFTANADFSKVNTYTEGMFSDVTPDKWYEPSVASAYEVGFMKGSSDIYFEPELPMKVSEALTIASRVHDKYHGNNTIFNQNGENWYDCYVDYAINNGIIKEKQFDKYHRVITRAEMAVVFSKSVPSDYLTVVNNISEIPDIPNTNSYFDEVLSLYKAGVVMGNDEYGTYKPDSPVTRAEAAAIIGRIALPENRLTKTLTDANYGDGYYLLNDRSAKFNTADLNTSVLSSWNVDNRSGGASSSAYAFCDLSSKGSVTAWRQLEAVSEGLLGLDMVAKVRGCTDGTALAVTDDEGSALFKLETKGGKYAFQGKDTGVDVSDGTIYLKIKADLDGRYAELYINGTKIGDKYEIGSSYASRFYITSNDSGISELNPLRLDIYKDYLVNDLFLDAEGDSLVQWTVNGEAKVAYTGGQIDNDLNSARLESGSVAKQSFNPVSGNVVFETLMLLPDTEDSAYISIKNGETVVAKILVKHDGIYMSDGTKLRHLTNNIWQTLRLEADTVNGKVLYKINGKNCGKHPADSFQMTVDNIEIGCVSGKVFFDDVLVYMTHEYDDYCPRPVPVNDDGYDVLMNMCSLWREGSHSGWAYISPYPDIEPVLGYYDEGIVEVADWEIKFMLENGIDVQHLCWYAPSKDINEPIKQSNFNFALHQGFFNAKYSDMIKFCIMWENADKNCNTLEQFKKYIWNYWMEYYFLDDRYYTIDNKLVFTVWNYAIFRNAFGGTNELVRDAVAFMNEDAKAHGFDGVLIFFADQHKTDASSFETMASIGGSGAYAYHWQQDGSDADATIARLDNNSSLGKIHILPAVSVGFNNIGWSAARKPLISTAGHKKVLEYIKNEYLPKYENWQSKTIIVSTWNEYGEGTYVMPCEGLNGFGYLENVAEVISGVTDHSSNIVPNEQQKARLGHIYPDNKTTFMKTDVIKPEASSMYTTLYSVTGEAFEDHTRITSSYTFDGVYSATVEGGDSYVKISDGAMFYPMDASEIDAIRIVLKTPKAETTQLFFTTETSGSISEDKSFKFTTTASNDFVEYVIDTKSNEKFTGTLKNIRFDIIAGAGKFEIKEFALLSVDESKIPTKLYVNGKPYNPTFDISERNGELYVTAEPNKSFFKNLRLYYEWSRHTGILYIKSVDNREVIFTVGSDKAVCDGKDVVLSEAVKLVDGLPELPLIYLLDALGITYENGDKRIDAYVFTDGNTEKYIEILKNRVPGKWEFEIPGDYEGFSVTNMTSAVENGVLKGTTKDDPTVKISGLDLKAKDANMIKVVMKHSIPDDIKSTFIQVFFTTDTSGSADQAKSALIRINEESSDGFVDYVFDLAANDLWKGTIKTLRIDPISSYGEFEIESIEIGYSEELEIARQKAYDEWVAGGFKIVNGDAEDVSNSKIFFNDAKNSKISIVEDEETKSNVWQNEALTTHSYTRQSVVWEAGKTYTVSVDVKLIGTKSGKTDGVETSLVCNARYHNSETSGLKDHLVVQKPIKLSDGWNKIEFSFTVPKTVKPYSDDELAFYTNPFMNEGVSYRFDNLKITVE